MRGLGAILGPLTKKGKHLVLHPPLEKKSPLVSLLGRAWAALERSWTRLGPLLGTSWGSLFGHQGAILSLRSPFKVKKRESQQH